MRGGTTSPRRDSSADPASGLRAVVTGGAGFLGSALVEALLARGDDVVCADRPDRLARHPAPAGVREVAYSLSLGDDAASLVDGAEVVLHLAHLGLPSSPSWEAAAEAAANVGAGIRLFDQARRAGVRRVIYASSGGTVYGATHDTRVDESAMPAPISVYGATKVAVETYLAAECVGSPMSGVSLRIGNAVGAGQLAGAGVGAPARFLALAAAGEPLHVWGDGTAVRDYVYVDDIVSAFVHATDAEELDGAFNVGSGVGHSIWDVITLVAGTTGAEPTVNVEPGRGFDVPQIVLDASRLHAATGWTPEVDLAEALRRMWATLTRG